MMKARLPLILPIFLFVVACISSCKKNGDGTSRHDMLLGKWLNTENGTDGNANGGWDAAEHTPIPAANAVTMRFNGDGTGSESGIVGGTPVSAPITWELQNGDNDLAITSSFGGTPDTFTVHIMSISTDNGMVTSDKRTGTLAFNAYTKVE